MIRTYLIELSPRIILNLTHPGRLGPVIRNWKGKRPWFDPHYDKLREAIEKTYVEGFDRLNGHYRKLTASIQRDGMRNPVMLGTGGPHYLPRCQVPPVFLDDPFVIMSEYLGGSRIYIAEKLELKSIPAILNDHTNFMVEAGAGVKLIRELKSKRDVVECFDQPPGIVEFNPERRGAYVNNMVYTHMSRGYNLAEQVRVRQAVLQEVYDVVANWLERHD